MKTTVEQLKSLLKEVTGLDVNSIIVTTKVIDTTTKNEVISKLEEIGAEINGVTSETNGRKNHHVSYDGLSLMIKYEKSQEEKCAELKAQLAELGCHY